VPKVTYIEANGTEHVVEVPVGINLMQAALNNLIPGIEGDCGGLCACATCHVYVDGDWAAHCGDAEELEVNILDFAFDVRDESRLACQITASEELDGLVLRIAERQY
jgi:2Fe-2S ferredoxin